MAGTHIHYSRDVKHMPRAFKLCRRWLLFLVHLCSCVTRGKGVEAEAGAVSSSFELHLRAEQTARMCVWWDLHTEPSVRVEGVRVSRALGDG